MNATLFCCLTCHPAAFLAIWGGQPKTQPPFLNFKGQPALLIIVGLAAALRVLCRKCCQPLFEIGVVGLHLNDAIEVLRTGKFNHRLLSELICHKDFQRFMLDAEIYVDRIADMRVKDMNAVLEAVRQMALMKNGGEENDLHLRTLEVAQIREDEYFGSLIADDLKGILRDIRNEHRPDTMTADETSLVATVQGQLQDAMNFEGSSEEKQVRSFLATFGIDYDKLSKEQFVTLIEILKLSKYMKSPINQRGKARPQLQHGKGKKKRK